MNTNPNASKSFNEKVKTFLRYVYEHGGSEYKGSNYSGFNSYQLADCSNSDEFERVMKTLKLKNWISWGGLSEAVGGGLWYFDVILTETGIREAEKELPQMPMIGLVNQQITTGDSATDEKINHAKKLFFDEPSTMDNKRSACEALSFVLEPLRNDLTPAITDADVNEFFLIVNRFDIRHNKAATKNLIYPEQLDWVFYSLLNTINTYTKLKARLENG